MGRKSLRNRRSSEPIGMHWIVLAFLFLQPLAIPLLGLRYMWKKTEQLSAGRSLFKVSVVFIGLFLLFMLVDYQGLEDFYYSFYFFGAGGIIGLIMSLRMIQQGSKDEKYYYAVEVNHLEKISDIALALNIPSETVVQDLQKMMQNDFFPNAKLDVAGQLFILNAAEREAVKQRTFRCSGCGATVLAISNQGSVCEYCGSPVNY